MPRLLISIALLVCLIPANAQTLAPTLALRGVVTDPSGAVVPGATVQLRGPGKDHRAKTDAGGRYTFTALAPGKYQLRISVDGFSPLRKDLALNQNTALDARLA